MGETPLIQDEALSQRVRDQLPQPDKGGRVSSSTAVRSAVSRSLRGPFSPVTCHQDASAVSCGSAQSAFETLRPADDEMKRSPKTEACGSLKTFPAIAELELGDLIEIFRFGYQHWVIYVGDGYVVHLAPPSEIPGAGFSSLMSTLTNKALVKKERLLDVVGRHHYRVNNKHDRKFPPLPPGKIVRAAEQLVGQEMLYKVTSENCEHFVTELRYGVARSDQVRDVLVGVSVAGLGLAALGLLGVAVQRRRRKNQ